MRPRRALKSRTIDQTGFPRSGKRARVADKDHRWGLDAPGRDASAQPGVLSQGRRPVGGGAAAEVERHRLLRRGIPFGPPWPDTGEHGLVFLAYQTSIVRQFEYVQRKWLNAQGSDPARGGWPVAW